MSSESILINYKSVLLKQYISLQAFNPLQKANTLCIIIDITIVNADYRFGSTCGVSSGRRTAKSVQPVY